MVFATSCILVCNLVISRGKVKAATRRTRPQGNQKRAEAFMATPREPTAVARVPAKN